jgi:hypothetical protein
MNASEKLTLLNNVADGLFTYLSMADCRFQLIQRDYPQVLSVVPRVAEPSDKGFHKSVI